MEFVITGAAPDPIVAMGLGRSFVIGANDIRDENGAILGNIERRCRSCGSVPRVVDYKLWQRGSVTAAFACEESSEPQYWFIYDEREMPVRPLNHFVCEEIHARTVLPWYPPGQCIYSLDDCVDPVSALFLFQMLGRLEQNTAG